MKHEIELLAPGGDIDSIKAAIAAGADAIYCGLNRFNARNRATNITFENLNGVLRLAHNHDCKVFLTLNIIIVESEIPALVSLLNRLNKTSLDGIIVQDLGVFYLLSRYFTGFKIHASTQLTTHNEGQIKFLNKLNVTRVNLSRELNLNEIKPLAIVGQENNISTEVFVYGSYCISFSGICYLSSVHGGNSGNRGRCSQPCRDKYKTTSEGKNFPLNLKDNSAYSNLKELAEAGVDAIKIEGRIKKFHYVYTVVNAWRQQLTDFYNNRELLADNNDLHKVFNRDFSNGFLTGNIDKNMFIDNPRNNAAIHFAQNNYKDVNIEKAKEELYHTRAEIVNSVRHKIEKLSISKIPLQLTISGKPNTALKVSVRTPDALFEVLSDVKLINNSVQFGRNNASSQNKQNLSYEIFTKKFKAINKTEYFIECIDLKNLQRELFIPFKELHLIKKKILIRLNAPNLANKNIVLPRINKLGNENMKPVFSLLISSPKDLNLYHLLKEESLHKPESYCPNTFKSNVYFQIPNCFKDKFSELIELFTNNNIIPWFPSILIGDDYNAAVEFLKQIIPKKLVTNNTGIAYEAFKNKISWIAGPYMNIANSYSLLCLKEDFNCQGAFISNELNKIQIKSIIKPDRFELYYSIYHPIELLTSRQCLFRQVTGCEKDRIDDNCIQNCEKSTSITNFKNESLLIRKVKGNYNKIYNENNYLNTDIVNDVQNLFSSFFIDLRDIKTNTKIEIDKLELVRLFRDYINGNQDLSKKIKQVICPSTDIQFLRGI